MGGSLVGEPTAQVPATVALGARDVLREADREATDRQDRLPSTVVQEISIDSR
jgi:hypothetical protein